MTPLAWELLTPYAIRRDGAGWFSGRVIDVATYKNTVILATAFGGIWAVNTDRAVAEGYNTSCLTDDWSDPNIYSLMQGPDNDSQLFAGTDNSLYYCELGAGSNGTVLNNATKIVLPVADLKTVFRILVKKDQRRITLGTGSGVWTAIIPADPKNTGSYQWVKATGLPGERIPGLCFGSSNSVHASVWEGTMPGSVFGIFKGVFNGDQLTFTKSKINWHDGLPDNNMARVSLASCASNPSAAFAVVGRFSLFHEDKDFRGLLQLDDSKNEWNDMRFNSDNSLTPPGAQGTFNNCIAAAPDNATIMAFGWQKGTYVFSDNKFKLLTDPTTHGDIHGLLFTKVENGAHTLYIGGDGGILQVTSPAKNNPSFNDKLNVFLPTLLFKDVVRRAYATIDVSLTTDGLISGGLQDNGCKFLKTSGSAYEVWRPNNGGDGGTNTFLVNGTLINREWNKTSNFKSMLWEISQSTFSSAADIGVPFALSDDTPRMEICTRIPAPVFKNKNGQLMHAISSAARKSDLKLFLLGLFNNNDNVTYHWEVIGHSTDANDVISAAASYDGRYVFVATANGKLYFHDVAKFLVQPANLSAMISLPPSVSGGSILQFEIINPSLAFALYTNTTKGHILVNNGIVWREIPVPVNEAIYSIAADWSAEKTVFSNDEKKLFFTTDAAVYQGVQVVTPQPVSGSPGVVTTGQGGIGGQFPPFNANINWQKATDNLPACPHNNHLRLGWDYGKYYLYLSTYGRSVYRAVVRTQHTLPGDHAGQASQTIVAGVVQDGGGIERDQTGHVVMVPPRQE